MEQRDRATEFVARNMGLGDLCEAVADAQERGDQRRFDIMAAEVNRRADELEAEMATA